MASASFKTPCPSCEAGVLVKDESIIGKKIDCPKCKYRFVVEAPNGTDKAVASKKPAAVGAKAEVKGPPAKKAAVKTKPVAKPTPDAEDEDEQEKEDRPKKKNAKIMIMGVALGGIGVMILAGIGVIVVAVAAYLILGKKGDPPRKNLGGPQPGQVQNNTPEPPAEQPGDKKKPKKDQKRAPILTPGRLAGAGPELTNLLPGEAQHVLHVFFKEALETTPLLGEAVFQPGAVGDDRFEQRMGFALKDVDDLIRAENYAKSWAFTVVHLKKEIDKDALTRALGLEAAAGSPMNHQDFSKVTKNSPWWEHLGRLSVGTLAPLPGKKEDRPLFLRIHDPQTLVFADQAPMQEFLARGVSGSPGETYATLKNPALKAMLDKLEKHPPEPFGRILLSAVTDLKEAQLHDPSGRTQWRFRPIWDVAHALPDARQRLLLVGASLARKGKGEPATYQYHNELECASDAAARAVEKDLRAKVAPDVARFIEMLLGLKVDVVTGDTGEEPANPMAPNAPPQMRQPPPSAYGPGGRPQGPGSRPPGPGSRPPLAPPPMGQPARAPVASDPDKSQIAIANTETNVGFTLNLVLHAKELPRVAAVADLLMLGMGGQLAVASSPSQRHDLALAEKRLGEQGPPASNYPRGVFLRKGSAARSAHDPGQRISWMAGLLPFLGRDALYTRIQFDASWRDPANWMTAHTLIPEFLDPGYPETTRFVSYPGIRFPLVGTHFVGIAGVGQDAPDYSADDPAVAAKLGVFGYDRTTSLDDIRKNRGLSQTGVMVQVPYDGPAGITPWMAGGGSTLRGVPEKDSIKPFVSTTNNEGKRGTFVLMADGSVRFVGEDVKDEVFKAMCTIKGPPDAAIDRDAPVVEEQKKMGEAAPLKNAGRKAAAQ